MQLFHLLYCIKLTFFWLCSCNKGCILWLEDIWRQFPCNYSHNKMTNIMHSHMKLFLKKCFNFLHFWINVDFYLQVFMIFILFLYCLFVRYKILHKYFTSIVISSSFSFWNDCLIFNFHNKLYQKSRKNNRKILWTIKILPKHKCASIYKSKYSHFSPFTIMQNMFLKNSWNGNV